MSENVNPENKCANLAIKGQWNDDALNIMMSMQYELQKFYGEKRNSVTPDDENKIRIKESLYHWNCFIAEIWELQERINLQPSTEEDKLELYMELTDCIHFLMNMFLYLGYREFEEKLDFYWSWTSPVEYNYKQGLINMVLMWGRTLDELPYKYWKTYENYEFNTKRVYGYMENMLIHYINICKSFGMTKENFYLFYIAKNEENYSRQKRGY